MTALSPNDTLGLFDTPPNRAEIRWGYIIVGVLFASLLVVLPFRDIRLRGVTAFIPAMDSFIFVGDLITATLLYGQSSLFQSRALLVLATGYLFGALLLIPHAMTFPGAFSAEGLLGAGVNTAAWLSVWQRTAFPVAVILYVLLRRAEPVPRIDRPPYSPSIVRAVLMALAVATVCTALATLGHDLLPSFYVNQTDLIHSRIVAYQGIVFGLSAVGIALLLRRQNSVLDLWLVVALLGWLIQTMLIMSLHARFTLGFYALYGIQLTSHLILLVALVAESNRLYARLVVSRAAQAIEREARLMSMNAVAAAIAHEIGQPLAAISLNSTVGLAYLTGPTTEKRKASAAFRAVNESVQRCFEIIRSVRAVFKHETDSKMQFGVNDLIRETAALLRRELADAKISLRLELDESMPIVFANRVQLQQVIINLLKNAIDASVSVRRRAKPIAISSRVQNETLLLEIADGGTGIAPEEAAYIFDAFHTTKANGTGIGLALCRTIVEDHGGRIWATSGGRHGAVFHIEVPYMQTH
jgi:signal transduction histidine kinase